MWLTMTFPRLTLGSLLFVLCLKCIACYPDQGKWTLNINQHDNIAAVSKNIYAGGRITAKVVCHSRDNTKIRIEWTLRQTPCWEEYLFLDNIGTNSTTNELSYYLNTPESISISSDYSEVKFKKYIHNAEYSCDGIPFIPPLVEGAMNVRIRKMPESPENPTKGKRDIANATKGVSTNSNPTKTDHPVYVIPDEGVFLFLFAIQPVVKGATFNATVVLEIKSREGTYLSASDWPLLPFYGTLCGVYSILAIAWMAVSLWNWRDLLRIQFWIAAVIVLGLLEKAVLVAEYESLDMSGELTKASLLFAEVISCAKRTLARILVLIVSMGFGIVKYSIKKLFFTCNFRFDRPRLGPLLQRAVLAGILYFVLATLEGSLRVLHPPHDTSKQALVVSLVLALFDALLCWWVFSSLVQTTRTLRLRRNLVKLSLYRHFTNTLILDVIASLIFMLWSLKYHRFVDCLTDWKELWVDEAFWRVLFTLLLVVICVLWRPTNNNQRYAFTPLLDSGDEEDGDQPVHGGFEGMKMRSSRTQGTPSPRNRESLGEDDDLKWIEENIPSMPESALPVLDSDEEIVTTKFEVSKMQ